MEPSISAVARSEVEYTGRVNLEAPQPSAELHGERAARSGRTARSQAAEETAAVSDSTAQAEETQRKAKAKVEAAPNPLNDLAIKFKVDPETNEVTLLILDKQSQKVVRTIPAEEMEKLKPGDLLELFA
jgi:uncharacterized FlaG/YvyC family protein